MPKIVYPPDLPIAERRDEISAAITAHQVVIVAGETGSGKTTQLPKICLELGRGVAGTIAHTQPRRIAARSVAERIAEELSVEMGAQVGYSVRFTDRSDPTTLVRLMTDGILLAEIQRDRLLRRYDTIIVDEAHERSLNIDFLLGYLRQLLPRRPDLKVIITSATADTAKFSAHFENAPVVEVSGRTYPVEVRYRPLESLPSGDPDDGPDERAAREPRDQFEGILDAVRELDTAARGDILVFLSGEREIRDAAEALAAEAFYDTEIVPLYARLSIADQHRVFQPHSSRRIVLSTNVAETSLTVPRIRYVIDPGTARISRYSTRSKVQRLPIEAISQASAAQRAGRCGRLADGICIRLYSAEDFASRPQFTEPEILRTNLASVILQMAALGLGDVAEFPFVDPPDQRAIRDGVSLLHELGAVAADADGRPPSGQLRLTGIGRTMAALPVDPRVARMLVAAEQLGNLPDVLVVAAALSIPDPRERPSEQQAAADTAHARFADEHSDFASYVKLWRYIGEQRKVLSGNQFRRMCRSEFLNFLRIREWQDLVGQLRSISEQRGLTGATGGARSGRKGDDDQPLGELNVTQLTEAVLAGLLSHIGLRIRDTRDYQGARGTKFVIARGSALAKRSPEWVVAAELVETSRLFARTVARVDPKMAERQAPHLVLRTISEPHWDSRRGAAMAYERVTLYGLPLVVRRRVQLGGSDPTLARELFIQHALVEGDYARPPAFIAANADLRESLADLEERTRRRDLLIDDEGIYAFYDARIPADVVSTRHFESWWKSARRDQPSLFTMQRQDLLAANAGSDSLADYPDTWRVGDVDLSLSYRFVPGTPDDGVTVHVPATVLARINGREFDWQVPALREELVTAMLRGLPKEQRRLLVPIPDTARAVLRLLDGGSDPSEPGAEPLPVAVQRAVHELKGLLLPLDTLTAERVPPHLRPTFAVLTDDGRELARGKDLEQIKHDIAEPIRQSVVRSIGTTIERSGLTGWPSDLEELPTLLERVDAGIAVRGYPAFALRGAAVDLAVFGSNSEQLVEHRGGVLALLVASTPASVRQLTRGLDKRAVLVLGAYPGGGLEALLADVVRATCISVLDDRALPWKRRDFEALVDLSRARVPGAVASALPELERSMRTAHELRYRLAHDRFPDDAAPALADVRDQLEHLMAPGFVSRLGVAALNDLGRYLAAIGVRLDRLIGAIDVDQARQARIDTVRGAYDDLRAALSKTRAAAPDVTAIGTRIEELRVSLFAQQLGTAGPVSEQRIYRMIDAVKP